MATTFFKKVENTATIAAGALWILDKNDITLEEEERHAPFNHLTVYNNSDQDCNLRLYGSNLDKKGVEYLPAGAALVFDKADNIKYIRPTIHNRGTGTIAVKKIIFQIRKVT